MSVLVRGHTRITVAWTGSASRAPRRVEMSALDRYPEYSPFATAARWTSSRARRVDGPAVWMVRGWDAAGRYAPDLRRAIGRVVGWGGTGDCATLCATNSWSGSRLRFPRTARARSARRSTSLLASHARWPRRPRLNAGARHAHDPVRSSIRPLRIPRRADRGRHGSPTPPAGPVVRPVVDRPGELPTAPQTSLGSDETLTQPSHRQSSPARGLAHADDPPPAPDRAANGCSIGTRSGRRTGQLSRDRLRARRGRPGELQTHPRQLMQCSTSCTRASSRSRLPAQLRVGADATRELIVSMIRRFPPGTCCSCRGQRPSRRGRRGGTGAAVRPVD